MLSLIALLTAGTPAYATPPRFEIRFSREAHATPITGRLVLALAKSARPEPRLAISPRGPALFAIDLDQQAPDAPAVIDARATAYPRSLAELPAGDYYAQAIVNVYEQVHRSFLRRVSRIGVIISQGTQPVEPKSTIVGFPLLRALSTGLSNTIAACFFNQVSEI